MPGPAPEPRLVVLTPRQREVIGHLAGDGASDAIIARRMGLDVETVHTHVRHAMQRAGAVSRTQLAVWLLRKQIVVRVENRSGDHWRKMRDPG